ncbi:hypothetical protein ID866_8600 [Astraeus odoratus]|nr:hypothetical protein ID866_8600 [Astraeus odoratus]
MGSHELLTHDESRATGNTSTETATALHRHAMDLYQRYQSGGGIDALEEAVSLNRKVLEICPTGHPDRSSYLNDLGNCMWCRYESKAVLGDLEEAIFLHQQALELYPVGHPDRSSSLKYLVNCIQCRYESQKALGDLQEAIYLLQQALELNPVEHTYRSSSLMHLAACMKCRYEALGTLGDLEDAISLYEEALELCPAGHPDRSACLMHLATCMQCRYDSLGGMEDLQEAISLFQQALDMCSPGSEMQTTVAEKLDLSLQDKFRQTNLRSDEVQMLKLQQALPHIASHQPSATPSIITPAAKRLIDDAVQDISHTIPPRLLDTETGILLTREKIIDQFYASEEYQTLGTYLAQQGGKYNDQHSNPKHTQSIATYFKYATLSHRWGSTEPTLGDVLGNGSVYEMPATEGLTKLKKFCHAAADHGYPWAWTDTCCIDKTNSVELQQAIGSMYLWYQKSGLTIVHLSDVSPSSSSGALTGSIWFKRGWTLQELLAPNNILFYTSDWSPYMKSTAPNHKGDDVVLKELAWATGIASEHITQFHAGVDDARERLQWATGRRTTQAEDLAYSLFGVFDIHLPVLYGEGKEKSLGRLLQEVLSRSHDVSILHWFGEQSSLHSCFPASITYYQPLPRIQPDVTSVGIQRALSRLQRLMSTDDALKVFNHFTQLFRASFANHTLSLPCVVHQVRVVKLRQSHLKNHTYEVHAVGLRSVQMIIPDVLKETTETAKLPYVLVRPWDRKIIDYNEQDRVMAGYKTLMALEQPFLALVLQRLPEGEYKRICTSRFIVVRTDDPASIVNSRIEMLDIV